MLLQIEVPAEALCADFALKRFLVVVRVHVECQIIDLMERLVTYLAFVRLLSAMRQLVILIIPFLMEALPAELANIGLITIVYSGVGVER